MENDYSTQLLCYLPMKPSTAAKGPVLVDVKVHGFIIIQSVLSGKKPGKLINTNTECPVPVGI